MKKHPGSLLTQISICLMRAYKLDSQKHETSATPQVCEQHKSLISWQAMLFLMLSVAMAVILENPFLS